ncbi:sulfatase-like hydrolase/transferase [Tomitella gaofuii]|uniref:sulfatase-like hydrolase/transferase n=1 Tax=Tomitella gaofuii TaxID=2760083 RepID=UPI0015FB0AB9|nr:arylsulfatase [Tomitella gaofuii]
MNRHSIPIAAHEPATSAAVDHRDQDASFARPTPVRPPQGAPNVLLVMLDDVGFGASSAFGGPCRMPTAERLADNGLKYTRFHTTALCSPTRAATLTGRNHHSVGMGLIAEQATAAPGYNGTRPASAATVARVLQGNGYATGAFGKMHQTPPWEITEAGPFDRWPIREGFDRFYGFLGAESDQYTPVLYQDFTPVHPPKTPEQGYHLSEDLVDRAAAWIDSVSTVDPDKPWLCYLPFGACHAPLHVPASHRDRYRGEFDHGWDRQREITLERQKELGVVPEDTALAPWAPGLPHWDDFDDDQRTVAARLMELYAAFLEHTDDQVGRLIAHLETTGALDNTLVLYMIGDNGASAEGGMEGSFNYLANINGITTAARESLANLDALGTEMSYPHYPASWAMALDTPYQWTKQAASHYGGTRNGLIAHWPKGITEPGVRHQWHHCVDITPTILEAAGIPAPDSVDGVTQQPMEGTAMNYTFNAADAEDRHITQYFEIFGNRGIYHDGWTAVAMHRAPWLMATRGLDLPAFSEDRWELYDTTTDWSQARDLAAEHPELLARLQERFLVEAAGHQVLPLDDRTVTRNAAGADRTPSPMRGRRSITLYPHMHGLPEKAAPRLFNTSYTLTAHLDSADGGCEGILASFGGRFGGLSLYVLDSVPVFCYTFSGGGRTYVRSASPLSAGEHHVVLEFAYDGGGPGRGGTATLSVDGEQTDSARIERTTPGMFSLNEQFDIGVNRGSPVSEDYADRGPFGFTGMLHSVRVELPASSADVSPEERRRMELAVH